MRYRNLLISLAFIFLAAIILPVQVQAEIKGVVTVFHAGSLTIPFEKIEKDFEALHPGVDVQRTAGGSTKMARLISDAKKPADIMASADYKVIDNNLIPEFATWNVRFAANQLVLCYTDKSKYADKINADNWYKILQEKGVNWGHSDPNLDPCGYRSLMVLQLAEKFYREKDLYQNCIDNRPEKNVKAKAVQLVNLIKSGDLDYGWEYISVASQKGLKYIQLDDHINLGNYKYDEFYKQARVKVTGKTPGSWITKEGQSCTYGITMLKNAPNPETARAFLTYLLSPENGLTVLKEMGQPVFIPCRVPSEKMAAQIPESVKAFVEAKN